ncbi:MAG: tetratricopeptide repeat protein [Terriglobales bacterium]
MSRRGILVHLIATTLLLAPLGLAQSSGSGTTSRRGRRGSAPASEADRKPLFLSGKVMLDDGMPPAERVAIERICNGRVRREAYTDAHGAFGFQMGAEAEVMQDASVGASDGGRLPGNPANPGVGSGSMLAPTAPVVGISPRDLMGCELRAALSGYRSDAINLAAVQVFDNPNVGTVFLHRMGKMEGTTVSLTTLQAPPDAKKAFERARNALAKNNRAEAQQELEKAIALYPKFAEAMSRLGELYSNDGRKDEAEKLFRAAMEADPRFVGPYYNLGLLASEHRDWERMAEWSDKALALDPYEFPATYLMNAIANYNLHNLDAAEKSAHTARRLDSQYRLPRIDFILANVLMQRGDYAGAAEELRVFLKYQPTGSEAEAARGMLGQTEQRIASGPAPGPK